MGEGRGKEGPSQSRDAGQSPTMPTTQPGNSLPSSRRIHMSARKMFDVVFRGRTLLLLHRRNAHFTCQPRKRPTPYGTHAAEPRTVGAASGVCSGSSSVTKADAKCHELAWQPTPNFPMLHWSAPSPPQPGVALSFNKRTRATNRVPPKRIRGKVTCTCTPNTACEHMSGTM